MAITRKLHQGISSNGNLSPSIHLRSSNHITRFSWLQFRAEITAKYEDEVLANRISGNRYVDNISLGIPGKAVKHWPTLTQLCQFSCIIIITLMLLQNVMRDGLTMTAVVFISEELMNLMTDLRNNNIVRYVLRHTYFCTCILSGHC